MINKLKNFIQPLRETIYQSPTKTSKECKEALCEYTSFVSIAEDHQQEIGTMHTTEQENFVRKIIFTEDGPLTYTMRQKNYVPKKQFETYQGFVEYNGGIVYVDVTQHTLKKHYNGCKGYIITAYGDFDKIFQTPTTKDLHYPDIDKIITHKFRTLEKEIERRKKEEFTIG